jgi:hypothetical protein
MLTTSGELDTLPFAFGSANVALLRRVGRAVDGSSLENCSGGNSTGGSNPSPSATGWEEASLERWVSGLNHSPAKTAYSKGTESSNLSLSAKV